MLFAFTLTKLIGLNNQIKRTPNTRTYQQFEHNEHLVRVKFILTVI